MKIMPILAVSGFWLVTSSMQTAVAYSLRSPGADEVYLASKGVARPTTPVTFTEYAALFAADPQWQQVSLHEAQEHLNARLVKAKKVEVKVARDETDDDDTDDEEADRHEASAKASAAATMMLLQGIQALTAPSYRAPAPTTGGYAPAPSTSSGSSGVVRHCQELIGYHGPGCP